MTDVVLKGEIHSSSGDLQHERELLKTGFDALVLEGAEKDPEYGPLDGWFLISLSLFDKTVGEIYQDKRVLLDLAEIRGTDVHFTRESDSEILDNTPTTVKLIGASFFYIIGLFAILGGIVTQDLHSGAGWLLMAAVLPLLMIRVYNTKVLKGEENRDEIIAERIMECGSSSSRILAIVGDAHIEGVKSNISDEFEVTIEKPRYGLLSRQHVSDVIWPAISGFGTLLVIYTIVIWLSEFIISIS